MFDPSYFGISYDFANISCTTLSITDNIAGKFHKAKQIAFDSDNEICKLREKYWNVVFYQILLNILSLISEKQQNKLFQLPGYNKNFEA